MSISNQQIEHCMLDLLRHRAVTASICPSDVARTLGGEQGDWRALMPTVRHVAAQLARKEIILITQGDTTLSPDAIDHGPIRLRRGAKFPGKAG